MNRTYTLIAIAVLTLSTGCPWKNERMYPIGPGVKASLVIYFKSNVSEQDINSFLEQTLMAWNSELKGYDHKPGVGTILRLEPVQAHEAIAVTFFQSASEDERQRIKSAVRASSIVYRVLENVIPNEVKRID